MKGRILKFDSQVSNISTFKDDPRFSKCKIKVMYAGINRNNTFFSEESINLASKSIHNIPIIGEFNKEDKNFGGHGGKIDYSDEDPKYVETTIPYGVVGESVSTYWEEENGKRYFVIDGAYLWTERFPEATELIGQEFNQSMEIKIIDGKFSKVDGKKVYEIQNFLFTGLCILGINKESDPDGNVEPCFEDASIVAYSLTESNFKENFYTLIKELKLSLKGGEGLNNKFNLTSIQLFEEANREINNLGNYTDENWGFEIPKYYLVDIDTEQNVIITRDNQQGYLVGFSFNINGELLALDESSVKRFNINYKPMEIDEINTFSTEAFDKFANQVKEFTERQTETTVKETFQIKVDQLEEQFDGLQTEYNKLKTDYESVNSKYTQKVKEEREEAEKSLFSQFASELSDEDMMNIKENKDKYSLQEIEEKLFVIVGKKKTKFGLKQNQRPIIDLDFDPNETQQEVKSYDRLYEKIKRN
jgi:hypothetical protein